MSHDCGVPGSAVQGDLLAVCSTQRPCVCITELFTAEHTPSPPVSLGQKAPSGGGGGSLADSIVGNSLFQRQTPNSSPDLPLTLQSQLPRVQNGHTSGLPGGIVV